jgi:hypothetical protein
MLQIGSKFPNGSEEEEKKSLSEKTLLKLPLCCENFITVYLCFIVFHYFALLRRIMNAWLSQRLPSNVAYRWTAIDFALQTRSGAPNKSESDEEVRTKGFYVACKIFARVALKTSKVDLQATYIALGLY